MTLDPNTLGDDTPALDMQTPAMMDTDAPSIADPGGPFGLAGSPAMSGTLGMSGTTEFGGDPTSYGGQADSDDGGAGLTQTARQVAEGVAAAAGDVTARIPEVAQTTRGALEEANRMVHRGSDQTLYLVGAVSIGFAVGLLVGGAHRLLVILSLIPAGLIGATIVERMESDEVWTDVLDPDAVVQGG